MRGRRRCLRGVLRRVERIERYVAQGQTVFFQDELLPDGVIRSFEVIGEAIKRLSDDFKMQQPQVEWRGFAGFRDVLIHQYDKIDMIQVWEIIETDLPALKQTVVNWLNNKQA